VTSRQSVVLESREYTLSPDPRLRPGSLNQSIVSAQLRDEHTLQAPSVEVTAETSFPKLTARSTVEGLAGVVGIPERAVPQLSAVSYDIPFSVRARRYVPFRTVARLPAQPTFPDTFARVDLGVVSLHREPVILRGRVSRAGAAGTVPVSGATVSITGYWVDIPPVLAAPPAMPPNLLSLRPEVYFDRGVAAQIRRRDLTITTDVSQLLSDAPAGVMELRLSNRVGIAAGEILRIDATDSYRTEFVTVAAVSGSSSAEQPAQITLAFAGRLDHRAGAVVERVTPQAPGANNALASAAVPGDASVLTAALAGMAGATTVEIDDGMAPPEYHLVAQFSTTTDADGFYRLPPLNRVGQLELTADDGVSPAVRQTVIPNYELIQNTVDFSLN
jgi:hypothetical protein